VKYLSMIKLIRIWNDY